MKQNKPPGSTWEAAIGRLADQAARSHDVAMSLLGEYALAMAEIIWSRAAEAGTDDADARIGEAFTVLRTEVDAQLTRIESTVRSRA